MRLWASSASAASWSQRSRRSPIIIDPWRSCLTELCEYFQLIGPVLRSPLQSASCSMKLRSSYHILARLGPKPPEVGSTTLRFLDSPRDATKLISQAWSLEVELYFYFVIGLCTYRSFLLTVTCLLFTLVYAVFAISKLTLYPFYWTPYGVGFAFFAGSFAYFMSSRIALGWRAHHRFCYALCCHDVLRAADPSFWQCFSILHRHQRGGRHGATNGTTQRISAEEWHRQNSQHISVDWLTLCFSCTFSLPFP